MPAPKQTEAVSRETIAYYNAAKGNVSKAAETAGLNRATYKTRLENAKRGFPTLVGTFEPSRGGPAAAPAEKTERPFEEVLAESRLSEEARFSKAKLKDATKLIHQLQDKLKDYEFAGNAGFKPAEWTLPTHSKKKREHMPYLLTSDFQVGEVIRADETEAGYGYDSATFIKRYRRLVDTAIYLSFHHGGEGWTYPGIIYARGGDTISGGIHQELAETDDLTPIEAVEVVFEEEAAGILKLAEAFGRVDVKSPDAAGNHDRNTMKPQSKKASAHSYDRIISYMLRRQFQNDKRIHFQTSPSFDVVFPIYKQNILLTHGDRIGSRGGQGFIGPAATIMRGAQKVMQEQLAHGRKIDRVDMGHFHTPICLDWVICNGCLPGYSEYAKSFRMRPTPPQQFLLYHHPERGVVDIKPINLLDA